MVHLSDISWDQPGEQAIEAFKKGDLVDAKVLDVDIDKERVSLGIKQLAGDPMDSSGANRGDTSGGIEVTFGDDAAVKAFIRKSDLSRDRAEQRPERFAVGDKVDARITNVDKASRRVSLSVKALEIADERDAVQQYGSSDAGASLGDILGAAMREKDADKGE